MQKKESQLVNLGDEFGSQATLVAIPLLDEKSTGNPIKLQNI